MYVNLIENCEKPFANHFFYFFLLNFKILYEFIKIKG